MTVTINLPDGPIDGFEIVAWRVIDSDWGDEVVERFRFVYRINSSWIDLFPNDERGDWGSPFKDEWMAYSGEGDREHFTSRAADRWTGIRRALHDREQAFSRWGFDTRAEAIAAARKRLEKQAEHLRERLAETETRIARCVE